jgi:alpha-aminoadipate carrier protein LysW
MDGTGKNHFSGRRARSRVGGYAVKRSNKKKGESTMAESERRAVCVICEGSVALPENVLVGEILLCGDCGTELEVVSLDPVAVEEAPQVQEDWGE